MRKFGFVLLIAGFVWLCVAAFYYDMELLRTSSRSRDALPAKETFTRDEVMQQISGIFRVLPERALRLIAPGCVMLLGGLIAGFGRRAGKEATLPGTERIGENAGKEPQRELGKGPFEGDVKREERPDERTPRPNP